MDSPAVMFFIKTSDWLLDKGVDATLEVCRRASQVGYNSVLCWDNMAQRPQPQDDYPEAHEFQAGLAKLGMRYAVQVAYLTDMTADAIGDRRILETNGTGDPECCLADPRIHTLWRGQAPRVMKFWPDPLFLLEGYDEIRRGGTHAACRPWIGRYGDLLAEHAKESIAYHREITGCQIAVWDDMFSPFANAKDGDFFGVKGGFPGSWKGLDSKVIILNWNTNDDESNIPGFKHFDGLGCRQIYAGYYDPGSGDDGIPAPAEHDLQVRVLDAVTPGSIVGYCYTTWPNDQHEYGEFGDLREYYPGAALIARFGTLGSGSLPPRPPGPQPPGPNPPPPAPKPKPAPGPDLPAARTALSSVANALTAASHHADNIHNPNLKAALKADIKKAADGVAAAGKALGK